MAKKRMVETECPYCGLKNSIIINWNDCYGDKVVVRCDNSSKTQAPCQASYVVRVDVRATVTTFKLAAMQ